MGSTMNSRNTRNIHSAALILLLLPILGNAGPVCNVTSGTQTAALVELYTSEGCSSCPPADRVLNALHADGRPALVVPLALHVTYWDQIGWRDPFGPDRFDMRQRQLLDQQRLRVAYTPQFFVAGRELRGWSSSLAGTIASINARRAPVTLTLSSKPSALGMVLAAGVVPAAGENRRSTGALYVALTESGLDTRVLRGENGGATLHHDAAARILLGPVPLVNGTAQFHQDVAVPAGWRRERLQAVAFVQEQDGPAILQAVGTAACQARGM
jgi:hypothetical protein